MVVQNHQYDLLFYASMSIVYRLEFHCSGLQDGDLLDELLTEPHQTLHVSFLTGDEVLQLLDPV